MSSYGKLYGVGVGPGSPDLMTLRSVQVLSEVGAIAIPRSSRWGKSMAWGIAESNVPDNEKQERFFLTFPMSKDPERVRPAMELAFEEVGQRIEAGIDVAFITLGDPLLFSTFGYLYEEAPRRWPGIEIEVVPGVTSITAVASAAGTPLADGQERIAIVPATYGTEDLKEILESFDTTVLMKVGSALSEVQEVLQATGLGERAVYVSRASGSTQRVERDVQGLTEKDMDCFATVLVMKKERSGVLLGRESGGGKS